MIRRWPACLTDPILLLAALAMVLVGTVVGLTSHKHDIDERVYRSTLVHMQAGDGYYTAFIKGVDEKEGRTPSQVRSVRPPTLSLILARFPEDGWRWMATIPALALCIAAGALAGPGIRSRQIAVGLTGLWMVVSLPMLYLHHELWGAPLVAFAGVAMRRERDGVAAVLCLLATGIRELFGLSLVIGLILGRDRRPWAASLAVAALGVGIHAHFAREVLDPAGFDPPLKAIEPYLDYLSPGTGVWSMLFGAVLLGVAAAGFWIHWGRRELRFLLLSLGPVLVMGAWGGRSYWALTWCAVASAAAALAVSEKPRSLEPA